MWESDVVTVGYKFNDVSQQYIVSYFAKIKTIYLDQIIGI